MVVVGKTQLLLSCLTFYWAPLTYAFTPKLPHAFPRNGIQIHKTYNTPFHHTPSTTHPSFQINPSSSQLFMSKNDEGGLGGITSAIIVAIILIFVGTSVLPLLEINNAPLGGADLTLGDAVATRQDDTRKLKEYSSQFDKLSRAKIQEKLNHIPVFYLSDSSNTMLNKIYLSYDDATAAASASDGLKVKCTTLDQVTYPLILKRGRMKMAPPPQEVQKAEADETLSFKLVPSTAALKDADELKLKLQDGDVPLFVADRLAFASNEGPKVPLFLEKSDCVTSYNRLRESGGNKLPAEPNIRTTTLFDELFSMEKGTRPGVSQLDFYAPVNDLVKASEML